MRPSYQNTVILLNTRGIRTLDPVRSWPKTQKCITLERNDAYRSVENSRLVDEPIRKVDNISITSSAKNPYNNTYTSLNNQQRQKVNYRDTFWPETSKSTKLLTDNTYRAAVNARYIGYIETKINELFKDDKDVTNAKTIEDKIKNAAKSSNEDSKKKFEKTLYSYAIHGIKWEDGANVILSDMGRWFIGWFQDIKTRFPQIDYDEFIKELFKHPHIPTLYLMYLGTAKPNEHENKIKSLCKIILIIQNQLIDYSNRD